MANTAKTKAARALQLEAALQEAAEEEFRILKFEYDGESYEVDEEDLADVDTIYAFEQDQVVTAMRAVLGDKQWEKFQKKRRTVKDLGEMTKAMYEAEGVTPGE